jgi:hypothetical protein
MTGQRANLLDVIKFDMEYGKYRPFADLSP